MVLPKGTLEILLLADGHDPKSFNDFTKISLKNKHLSSATVSRRLDELVTSGAMEEVISKSKNGRKVIAYKTTEKGKKIIEHAKFLEEIFAFKKMKLNKTKN